AVPVAQELVDGCPKDLADFFRGVKDHPERICQPNMIDVLESALRLQDSALHAESEGVRQDHVCLRAAMAESVGEGLDDETERRFELLLRKALHQAGAEAGILQRSGHEDLQGAAGAAAA